MSDDTLTEVEAKQATCCALKYINPKNYYSANILSANRFVDFLSEKQMKISLRGSWLSNITPPSNSDYLWPHPNPLPQLEGLQGNSPAPFGEGDVSR